MSENQFLQSFFAVSASAVLVSGTLLLLTSTAPWNPPQRADGDPSTPDAAGLAPDATASIDIALPQAPLASDQGDTEDSIEPRNGRWSRGGSRRRACSCPKRALRRSKRRCARHAAQPRERRCVARRHDADASIAASAEAASDAGGNGPSAEVAVAVPLAEVADLRRDTATDQIAAMLTALPPRPITSDKSEAATSEVATALVAEPPAPPPPPASDVTESCTLEGGNRAGRLTTCARACRRRCTCGSASAKGRRGGWSPATVAASETRGTAARTETGGSSGGAPSRSRQAGIGEAGRRPPKQDTSPQATEQPRSGSGPWQAMALAPADKPVLKVPTARPNNAAYGSQVGRRLPGISLGQACAAAPRSYSPSARTAACAG